MSVIITLIRLKLHSCVCKSPSAHKITLCVWKSHFACRNHSCASKNHIRTCRNHTLTCQNHTLRVEITLVRVEITVVSVVITFVHVKLTHQNITTMNDFQKICGNHSHCAVSWIKLKIDHFQMNKTMLIKSLKKLSFWVLNDSNAT
jgi:hypothetical protein